MNDFDDMNDLDRVLEDHPDALVPAEVVRPLIAGLREMRARAEEAEEAYAKLEVECTEHQMVADKRIEEAERITALERESRKKAQARVVVLHSEVDRLREAAQEVVTCAANGTNFDSFDITIATLAQVLERDQ